MEAVKIRGRALGEGTPVICVSLTGKTNEELFEQAALAAESAAQMAEWRADLYDGTESAVTEGATTESLTAEDTTDKSLAAESVAEILPQLRSLLGEKILLFTVRTKKEGGEAELLPQEYANIIKAALNTGCIDMADIEMSAGEAADELIAEAAESGVCTVISWHDFEKTPDDKSLRDSILKMQETGAQIVKVAVMPESEEDVSRVMALAKELKDGLAKKPFVLISMGEMGAVTRINAEEMGSAFTFGALTEEQASAPGQIEVSRLAKEIKKR
ncbi:MAG: type I 3-dehydroquinate dehydratase [Firmicutes bacterium]|nr:type I 3-dehydroquinate dehydratase [Bacillota bacterium]